MKKTTPNKLDADDIHLTLLEIRDYLKVIAENIT